MSAINPIPYAGQGVAAPYVPPAPQSTDPLQVARELQQFQQQGAMGPLQVQGAQQQVQAGALSLQQQQQALNDQNIIRQFYMGQGAPPAGGGQTPPAAAVAPPAAAPTAAQPGLTPGPAAPPQAVPAGAPQAMPAARPAAIPGAPPVVGLDLGALARAGVSGGMLQSLAGTQLKYAADYQNLTKGQQEISDKNHADAAKALQGLYYAAPEDQQAGYAGVRDMVRRLAPDDPGLLPDQLPADPKQAQDLLAMHIGFMGAHESLVANAKSAAETAKALSDKAEADARVPGLVADSRKSQAVADAIDTWSKGVSAGKDPGPVMIHSTVGFNPEAENDFQARYANAAKTGNYEQAQAALTAATEYGTRNNPTTLAQQTAQKVNEVRATAPIETGKAIATAKALRMGDNPAVAGVAPAAVGQVQNQAIKLDEQYVKEKAATDAMGKFLDLAQSGNKAAGSNLPLVGVETLNAINGIKRINSTEITQYQGAGDLLDRVKGAIGKIAVGQPIPQNVLNDIRELHQTLGQQSYQSYSDSLNSLNARTGAKFAPTLGAPNIQKPAQAGASRVGSKADFDKLPSGATYVNATDGKTYRKP